MKIEMKLQMSLKKAKIISVEGLNGAGKSFFTVSL